MYDKTMKELRDHEAMLSLLLEKVREVCELNEALEADELWQASVGSDPECIKLRERDAKGWAESTKVFAATIAVLDDTAAQNREMLHSFRKARGEVAPPQDSEPSLN
jgi:hypothetical protein